MVTPRVTYNRNSQLNVIYVIRRRFALVLRGFLRNNQKWLTTTRLDNIDVENWKVFNDDYLGMEDNSTVECLFTVQWYPRVILVIMYEIILLLRGHAWPNFIRLCSSSLAETLVHVLSLDIILELK